ncbi:TniB family NTP-binding protein [Methylobacterium sp. 10]|uniref:TniB family NTP-binding protein n=1 Tax=Methylobacterium sp. 10 TaxID=1101191 RepID=UPI00048694B5|nr:TniB family NTP-binding protein [Methylobacterium sp. 10]
MSDPMPFHDKKLDDISRRRAAALPVNERKAMIDRLLVPYPRFNDLSTFVRRFHRPVDDASHATGQLGALLGASRSGKTWILKNYTDEHPPSMGDYETIRPVIYIQARKGMGAFDLIDTVGKNVGYRSTPKIKTSAYIDRIVLALIHHKVELVIMDDIDNALSSATKHNAEKILSFVQEMIDSAHCNVLCGGRAELWNTLNAVVQIEGRGSLPYMILKAYDWSMAEERDHFRLLLDGIDNRLPFKLKSDLNHSEMAAHFYYISGGLVGRVMNYVKAAAFEAMNDRADRIEQSHLVYAAKLRMRPGSSFVPFQDRLAATRLTANDYNPEEDDEHHPPQVTRDTFTKKRPRRSA